MPRGGLRNPRGGRPVGSKNRIPKSKEAINRLNDIVTELETGEYLYSTPDKKYLGSAMELLQAIYRAESLPVKIRLYAATKAVDHEPKPVPQAERDAEADEAADFVSRQLDKLHREHSCKQDEQLHQWIDEGKLTEEQALLARSQWVEDGDAAWEPHKFGYRADTVPLRMLQNGVNARENGPVASDVNSVPPETPQSPRQPNGHAQTQRVRLMYSHPCQEYTTLSGKLYQADNGGEMVVDEEDVQELYERLGARDRR